MNDILFLMKLVSHENCTLTNSVCGEGLRSRPIRLVTDHCDTKTQGMHKMRTLRYSLTLLLLLMLNVFGQVSSPAQPEVDSIVVLTAGRSVDMTRWI